MYYTPQCIFSIMALNKLNKTKLDEDNTEAANCKPTTLIIYRSDRENINKEAKSKYSKPTFDCMKRKNIQIKSKGDEIESV